MISVSDTSRISYTLSKVIDDLNIELKSLTSEEMGQLGKFYLEGKGSFERNLFIRNRIFEEGGYPRRLIFLLPFGTNVSRIRV